MIDTRTAVWPEVEAAIRRGCAAVLAVGAQEQHGPHCPLATDTFMAAELAWSLAEATGALLLPPLPYGDAWNNARFPGTVSISFDTLRSLAKDIALSLQSSGVRALVLVNGHYGNHAPLELACRELKSKHAFSTLLLDYPGLEKLAGEICESQPAAPSFYHADELETSIMLAIHPDAVRMERAQAEYPLFPPGYGTEPVYLDSLSKSGVFGDPRPATAEKGRRLLDGLLEESLKIVRPFLSELGLPNPSD